MMDVHNDAIETLFLATFRGMPTVNAEGWIESEGSIRKGAHAPKVAKNRLA